MYDSIRIWNAESDRKTAGSFDLTAGRNLTQTARTIASPQPQANSHGPIALVEDLKRMGSGLSLPRPKGSDVEGMVGGLLQYRRAAPVMQPLPPAELNLRRSIGFFAAVD